MRRPLSQRMTLLAALCSLPATALLCWLVMRGQYQRTPEYKEFVTGYTTWTAYFKDGDMTLAYLAIIGLLAFFVVFTVLFYLLSGKVTWLQKNIDRQESDLHNTKQNDKKQENSSQENRSWQNISQENISQENIRQENISRENTSRQNSEQQNDERQNVSQQNKEQPGRWGLPGWYKKAEELCFLVIFSEFSLAALCKALQLLLGEAPFLERIFPGLQLLVLAAALFLWISEHKWGKPSEIQWLLRIIQLPLPLVFLWIARYEYIREGEVITLYDSLPMKAVAGLAAAGLLAWNIYAILIRDRKIPEARVYLSSFLSLAVFASYTLPSGTISGTPLEMYHYGELSGPLHQLLSFGTIPYIDTMPIHGVCDYFQAGIWYLLFDGTYAAFEPAMVIGCVIIAVITAAVCYRHVDNKLAGLLCVLLFSLFGDKYYYVRWAFALPFILIVFSGRVRKDFPRLLWNWTFISILSIAWNPSIGGACALAALPMVIGEGMVRGGWKSFLTLREKEGRRRLLPAYIPLLILGILYIPMFLEILHYITENSEMIMETTGDMLMEELTSPYVWYATFGFALPLLGSLFYLTGKKGDTKRLGLYAFLFLLLFNLIIVKYTFVRTQFGERGIIAVTICSLFLVLMVLLPGLGERPTVTTIALASLIFVCTAATKGSNLLTMPGQVFSRSEITEDYVWASAEETGIEELGDIYITPDQKEELMNLNELANDLLADYQFVDMTNQLSHYNILNKKVLLPFSSTYNTNNLTMQERAVSVLEELQPEVIVVSPAWEHDSGSLSTRNYYLYQYLAANYTPCKYKNIIFLTNDDTIRAQFDEAYEELGQVMHKERLQMLPKLWGNAYLEDSETEDLTVSYSLADTNTQSTGENTWTLTAEENYFLYTFDEPRDGSEIAFLRINVERADSQNEDQTEGQSESQIEDQTEGQIEAQTEKDTDLSFEGVVYFMDEGKSVSEGHRFIYDGGEGSFLIPLSTSPYWSYSENLSTIMLDFIGGDMAGEELQITLEWETLAE